MNTRQEIKSIKSGLPEGIKSKILIGKIGYKYTELLSLYEGSKTQRVDNNDVLAWLKGEISYGDWMD